MRLILLILVFVSLIQLASTTVSAGISTKRQDILKLIGTTYAHNGKFAWVEINGEDYGWTREGGNVGKYKIVMVEMGKVKLELFGRIVELKLLPEDAQWSIKTKSTGNRFSWIITCTFFWRCRRDSLTI